MGLEQHMWIMVAIVILAAIALAWLVGYTIYKVSQPPYYMQPEQGYAAVTDNGKRVHNLYGEVTEVLLTYGNDVNRVVLPACHDTKPPHGYEMTSQAVVFLLNSYGLWRIELEIDTDRPEIPEVGDIINFPWVQITSVCVDGDFYRWGRTNRWEA